MESKERGPNANMGLQGRAYETSTLMQTLTIDFPRTWGSHIKMAFKTEGNNNTRVCSLIWNITYSISKVRYPNVGLSSFNDMYGAINGLVG